MPSLYSIQLPVFEGPLDLLLRLIEQEELDITTVALARVADQYLAHLDELEQRQTRDLADFLVVAAKLLLIKSQALLPQPSKSSSDDEPQDVGEDLVHQLQLYKQFKEVAALLHEREEKGLHSYIRLVPLPKRDPELDMGDVTLRELLTVAREALDVVTGPPVGEVVSPITVTIDEQIELIERRLTQRRQIGFRELLSQAVTRIEIIATLLALLELIKQDSVRVRQEQLFGDITIARIDRSSTDGSPAAAPPGVAATKPAT